MKLHLGFLGDGQNYHVQRWLPALAKAGLKVTLFTFREPSSSLSDVDVAILSPPIARYRGRLSIFDSWLSGSRVRHLLDEHGVDVLMASYATHYGFAGTRSGFRPLVLQTWTFDVSTYPIKGGKRFILGPAVRSVIKKADMITTDGEALRKFVEETYPSARGKTHAVRWGANTDEIDKAKLAPSFRTEYNIPPDAPIVVFGRGIDEVYNPSTALDGAARLLNETSHVYAVILTLGHTAPAEISKKITDLKSHSRCLVFDDFVSRDVMSQLWIAADITVSIPNTDGISEGVLEAMYGGAIPVVSDIPSNRSFLKDKVNGYFLDRIEADALVQTLTAIVSDLKPIKERMIQRNADWVRQHASLSGTASLVASLIEQTFNQYHSGNDKT